MNRHIQYLKYVLRHKWFVFLACMKLNVSFVQAVVHDWSKFLPSEWIPYARTFYAPDGSKQYLPGDTFARAWNHHQKRNKHHWQYWLITWDKGTSEPLPMPEKYIREMLADWIGAGRAIHGRIEVAEWYEKNRENIKLHTGTRRIVERLMEENFDYKRKEL